MPTLILSFLLLLQAPTKGTSAHRKPEPVAASAAQIAAIRETLRNDESIKACAESEPVNEVLRKLSIEKIQLSPGAETMLVEAGPGCRGAHNGSMWIVRFDRGNVTVLAAPADGFEGWFASIE